MRIDGSAFAELLKIVDDHQRPSRDTGIHNPIGANLGTERDSFNVSFPVRPGHINLLQPLELRNGDLRDQQGVVANFGFCLDTAELPRSQEVFGIGESGSYSNGAGLVIHLAVHESDLTLLWKVLAI